MLGAGVHPHRLDPGDRRRDRRGGRPGRRAAVVASAVQATRPRTFPGRRVRPAVRAGDQAPRARASATTRRSSTTSCATTASTSERLGDRPRSRCTAELVDIPSVSLDEAGDRRPVEAELRAVPVARGRPGRRQRRGPHRPRPAAAAGARRPHRHRPGQRQRRRPRRGRHALGPRRVRHEERPGRDARAGPHRRRARRRRHLRLLRRPRRSRPSTAGSARCSRARPTCSPATSPCSASPPRRHRGRLPGHDAAARCALRGRPGPHRPAVDGPQRHPPPRPRCSTALDAYEERRPVLDGCEYREALQAVRVEGGVAGNVVPDLAVAHGQPPLRADRTPAEAEAHVRELLAPVPRGRRRRRGRRRAPTARRPALDHPLLAALDRAQRPRGAGQARLDRRRPLRRARHPGRQLRARRRDPRPHGRRAGRAGPHRAGASTALADLPPSRVADPTASLRRLARVRRPRPRGACRWPSRSARRHRTSS